MEFMHEMVKTGLRACIGDGKEIAPGVVIPKCEECPYAEKDGTCNQLARMHMDALEVIEELEAAIDCFVKGGANNA